MKWGAYNRLLADPRADQLDGALRRRRPVFPAIIAQTVQQVEARWTIMWIPLCERDTDSQRERERERERETETDRQKGRESARERGWRTIGSSPTLGRMSLMAHCAGGGPSSL